MFEKNWTLKDIDEMDIFYYLEVLAYKIKNINTDTDKNKQEKEIYIDECSWL